MSKGYALHHARLTFADGDSMRLDAGTTADLFELLRVMPDQKLKRASASFVVEGEQDRYDYTWTNTTTTAYAAGLRIYLKTIDGIGGSVSVEVC